MKNDAMIAAMLVRARAAQENAYAPYSKFKVGACIRTERDEFFSGCNNENAAYSLAQCAEATAIGNMVTSVGASKITDVVIVATSAKPCTPCGSCRQRLYEFSTENTRVHMFNQDGSVMLSKLLNELLPESFGVDFLQP